MLLDIRWYPPSNLPIQTAKVDRRHDWDLQAAWAELQVAGRSQGWHHSPGGWRAFSWAAQLKWTTKCPLISAISWTCCWLNCIQVRAPTAVGVKRHWLKQIIIWEFLEWLGPKIKHDFHVWQLERQLICQHGGYGYGLRRWWRWEPMDTWAHPVQSWGFLTAFATCFPDPPMHFCMPVFAFHWTWSI